MIRSEQGRSTAEQTKSAGASVRKIIAWAVFTCGLAVGAYVAYLVIQLALDAPYFQTNFLQERLVKMFSAIAALLFCVIGIVSLAAAHRIGGIVDDIAAMLTRLKEWDNPSD